MKIYIIIPLFTLLINSAHADSLYFTYLEKATIDVDYITQDIEIHKSYDKRVQPQNGFESYLSDYIEGAVEKPEGVITSYLVEGKTFKVHSSQDPKKGKKAVTNYKTLKKNKGYSLLKVNLETGRKNQIRVHMQDIGHSIVGDKKYGVGGSPIKRLGLHAQQLSFIHPASGEKLDFEAKIPNVFLRLF